MNKIVVHNISNSLILETTCVCVFQYFRSIYILIYRVYKKRVIMGGSAKYAYSNTVHSVLLVTYHYNGYRTKY